MAKPKVISVANQKGGVGKSTTVYNLGAGLALDGKNVLLLYVDPQRSLTISLGHPQPDRLPVTLADMMGKVLNDQPITPGEGILHHPEGFDLMPADIQLSGMEVSLVNAMSRETVLRQYLDTVKKWITARTLPERLPPCCGIPTAVKSRSFPQRFPTPSGPRRAAQRVGASSPMTPVGK